jgi:phosphomethylpyrimidine synthase
MTQLEQAKHGKITLQMRRAAAKEKVPPEFIRREVTKGRAVIPANINHKNLKPVVIGRKFTTKINANLGLSDIDSDLKKEMNKLSLAVRWGADVVMDLSTGKNLRKILQMFIDESSVPVGTVPIYKTLERVKDIKDITPRLLLEIIEEEAEQGVDFMTIHAGLLRRHIPFALKRTAGIVSRGGAMLAKWMTHHKKENPLYTHFDDICKIFRHYDVTFSLGDGLRPGALADASDKAQYAELDILGKLVTRSRKCGVQVMVEGPGHVPLNKVEENITRAIKVCSDAPFYVLGPVVTDIAAGYDHISSAIGATIAAWKGAAFLCYVTPSEHLGLPDLEDVRQGVVAYKIAAHAGDIAKGLKGARDVDDKVSAARKNLNWRKQIKFSLDPDRAENYHKRSLAKLPTAQRKKKNKYCSMCGSKFCAVEISNSIKEKAKVKSKKSIKVLG